MAGRDIIARFYFRRYDLSPCDEMCGKAAGRARYITSHAKRAPLKFTLAFHFSFFFSCRRRVFIMLFAGALFSVLLGVSDAARASHWQHRALQPQVVLDEATFNGGSAGSTNFWLGIPYAKPPYVTVHSACYRFPDPA